MDRERRIPSTKQRRRGFTLLEGLIAAVVLALLVLGVAGALSASYEQSASVRATSTAINLARQLADEIVSKPFDSSDTLGGGGPRSAFANVSAYHNYTDNSTALPMLSGGSLDVTGSDAYVRKVTVQPGAQASIDLTSPATNFAIVTVKVTTPTGEVVSIPEFVANYPISR
jgi:prepilin-type N-terminal cleavage/methylation domain-containing protein